MSDDTALGAASVVGTAFAPRTIGPLTRTDFVRYQGASGDFNPIHHDEPFAQAAGFPSVFSVGMLAAGAMGSYLTDHLGAQNVRRLRVQFRDQVWPGDTLTLTARVTRGYLEDAEHRVDLEVSCVRQTNSVALSGTATFAVPA